MVCQGRDLKICSALRGLSAIDQTDDSRVATTSKMASMALYARGMKIANSP